MSDYFESVKNEEDNPLALEKIITPEIEYPLEQSIQSQTTTQETLQNQDKYGLSKPKRITIQGDIRSDKN